ncbi:MAG: branched-chain amino acid ABC transporter permease, partial [Actinobacteria bacterium]|nr:branched-chain amino acid ABC transporter permease [Actinomycetota bacterium]
MMKDVAGLTRFNARELFGPLVTVLILSIGVGAISASLQLAVQFALCNLVMVIALQVFVGNSGVLSFGHGAFAMVGAWVSGMATASERVKGNALALQELWQPLIGFRLNLYISIIVAMALGATIAALTGAFLMRLNGLAAGIATFALLGLFYNFFFNNITLGPGSQALPAVPKFQGIYEPLAMALAAIVIVYFFNISATARSLRASREDLLAAPALGVSIQRVRWIAFTISGALAGLSGAMYVHVAGTWQVQDYYLVFTFLTLAMLVIGGSASLWGAVVGTLVVTAVGQI